jgi:hypothetical protein
MRLSRHCSAVVLGWLSDEEKQVARGSRAGRSVPYHRDLGDRLFPHLVDVLLCPLRLAGARRDGRGRGRVIVSACGPACLSNEIDICGSCDLCPCPCRDLDLDLGHGRLLRLCVGHGRDRGRSLCLCRPGTVDPFDWNHHSAICRPHPLDERTYSTGLPFCYAGL